MKAGKRFLIAGIILGVAGIATAENPIVQTCFTTDPAPMVYNDTLYVYTGHDEDNASFFEMFEWRVYSTTDMVNWTDHGSPLSLKDFSWADDRAWAPQCIERNGHFYLYVPVHSKLTGAMAIGVGISDSPTGPFHDALGKPLADGNWDYIDPTVFIDDDGQAYLYWGNPNIYYVKLNEDMISYSGGINKIVPDAAGFGNPPSGSDSKSSYTEGPWLCKRNGNYFLLYAAGGIPEHIAYSVSSSPTGPWTYKGVIMPTYNELGSFTNHCGVIDYKDNSYFFYHSGNLPGGGGFDRSVCVEKFSYNSSGFFPTIKPSKTGPKAIATFNPYKRIEAETIAWSEGLKSAQNEETGVYITHVHAGDYIKLENVDFKDEEPVSFGASVLCPSNASLGNIEVYINEISGEPVARLQVTKTGDGQSWEYRETPMLKTVKGVHDVYFYFKGRQGADLFDVDYWTFKPKNSGIQSTTAPGESTRTVVYDLMGRKVLDTEDATMLSTLRKGVYVMNGKKVIL